MSPADPRKRETAIVRWLGTLEYELAWELQKKTRDQLIEAKRSDPPVDRPHVFLGVVHPPVYTLGKSADATNLLADATVLSDLGARAIAIDRGGDITFHGPGQLVLYPVLDLERIFTDLGRYLRTLEEAVIETIAEYGIRGNRVAGRTGVWVGPDEHGPERKICAMGIHCSRWVTTHGLALNVDTDLDYFRHIVPCGIDDRGVTSMTAEQRKGKVSTNNGPTLELKSVFGVLVDRIAENLGLDIIAEVGAQQ